MLYVVCGGSLVCVCDPACQTWGPQSEIELTVQIKLKKETLPEWLFFLGLSVALCPKSCTEDSVFQFYLPRVVLALVVCFSFGRCPRSPLASKCSILDVLEQCFLLLFCPITC